MYSIDFVYEDWSIYVFWKINSINKKIWIISVNQLFEKAWVQRLLTFKTRLWQKRNECELKDVVVVYHSKHLVSYEKVFKLKLRNFIFGTIFVTNFYFLLFIQCWVAEFYLWISLFENENFYCNNWRVAHRVHCFKFLACFRSSWYRVSKF